MFRKLVVLLLVVSVSFAVALPAQAASGKPNFGAAIYADGVAWGTKGLGVLPDANESNEQSFDKLYLFANGDNPQQLAVAEAGPGNPRYNGGRWYVHTVTWDMAFLATQPGGIAPLITSEAQLLAHMAAGHLVITPGQASGPTFFLCPLLPVK